MAAIDALRDTFAKGSGRAGVNADFLEQAGASPPADFDAQLAKAFALEGTPPILDVTYDPTKVTAVANDAFSVPDAQLSFLGYAAAQSDVTLRFAQSTGPLAAVVEVVLAGWTWSTTFPAAAGWPFSVLSYAHPTFAFATDRTEGYPWSGGDSVTLEKGQNFMATVGLAPLSSTLGLIEGLKIPASVTLAGPVEVDEAARVGGPQDDDRLAYPEMDLEAVLAEGRFDVLGGYLEVSRPRAGLQVATADETVDEDGRPLTRADGQPAVDKVQTPLLFVGLDLRVGTKDLELIAPMLDGGGRFAITLAVDATSPPISPADAIDLVSGGTGQSFLTNVPAPLQQFLASVGLTGLALSGALSPSVTLTTVGATLGTGPGVRYTLLEDPTGGQEIALTSFTVVWQLLNPLGAAANRASAVLVTATLSLWPKVFKGHDPSQDGIFEISIDQTMRVEGRFSGTAALSDLLAEVSGGHVELPSGVSATFSDVDVVIDPRARTYAFGCTLDADFDFVTTDGDPLLSIAEARFELAATTPARGGTTAYRGSVSGIVIVGPVALAVAVRYDGARQTPGWDLSSDLARPLALGELVDGFLDRYDLPSLIPRTLTVDTFSLTATVPSAKSTTAKPTYSVSGSFRWTIDALPGQPQIGAKLALKYDGSQPPGAQYSGSAVGELKVGSVDLLAGYAFDKATRTTLWLEWEGLRGTYQAPTLALTAKGWTVGRLVQGLVRGVGPADFTLDPPWDFLNKISLDGLSIVVDLSTSPPSFSAKYAIRRVDLGFLVIDGLTFTRDRDGKVLIAFSGSTTISSLQSSGLFPPKGTTGGRDVQNMPSIPGGGTTLFELWLLALGQRISLRGTESFKDIEDAVSKLEKAPGSGGATNPINPAQQQPGQPYYDPRAGWLAAVHFGLLRAAGVYTLECRVIFADPALYGLQLKFNGDKAKALAGLEIDVLYKKVTDDVGLYQIEFSVPQALRQLEFGAFSVTLPSIGIKIYTNGDFLFDFGFPYNGDFSRSFGVSAQIGPVPVVGALGFYFGRLSIGSQAALPARYVGTFSPAIVFGLGVTLGVGRTFQKGPLTAGLTLTVFGIVEGTIASWHPPATQIATGADGGSTPVQADYFFRLKGSFGIVGKLYGSIDFAVIKADVDVTITLQAKITYESYQDIKLSASASVSVSVSLTIDFGLFSIRISFSFSATISADLTISTGGGTPPWAAPQAVDAPGLVALPAAAGPAAESPPKFKEVLWSTAQLPVTLHPAPQFTVVPPPGGGPADQQGAFVFLLAMDAPAADADDTAPTSFDRLCSLLLPWVVDAFVDPTSDTVDLATFAATTSVSRATLQSIVDRLAAGGDSVIPETAIESSLLAKTCAVDVVPASADLDGAAVFPPFGALSLTVPAASGTGTDTIAFDGYCTVTEGYRKNLAVLLRRLAARVSDDTGGPSAAALEGLADDPEPLNRFLFEDWFGLVAQQLLQAGADAIADYAHAVTPQDTIQGLVDWARAHGNPAVTLLDVATPNATVGLTVGRALTLHGIAYVVQAEDSLGSIAQRYSDTSTPPRWTTATGDVLLANKDARGVVAPNATITTPDGGSYVTRSGDSFALVARALHTTPEALAKDASLYPRTDLLVPACTLAIPDVAYVTGSDDTLAGIAAAFDLSLAAVVEANAGREGLFRGPTIRIAGLDQLLVADVWDALLRDRRPAQVAGMVSRFQLHGVRLPTKDPAGLALPADFLYPAEQDDYGLYQLTGQQFPTPAFPLSAPPSYSITLTKGAGLEWLRLGGSSTAQSLALKLDAQAQRLAWVLAWAQANGFAPQATIAPQADALAPVRRYAARTATPWSTSDVAALAAIATAALDVETVAAVAATAPQVEPILWDVPDSLLQGVGDRLSTLAAAGMTPAQITAYLPAVRAEVATTDPATQATDFTAVDDFAMATRVQFQVKRLAQEDDRGPQRPEGTTAVPPSPVNSGSPGPPLAPYCYELVAPNPADAVLLERLLVALVGADPPEIAGLFLLYPNAPGTAGLTSRAAAETVAFLTQTNLSTETSPDRLQTLFAANEDQPKRGILNSAHEFVKLLWELATVRAGGTYLFYQLPGEAAGLPPTIFDSSGVATMTLVIAYGRDRDLGGAQRVTGAVNAFFTTAPVDVGRSAMTLASCSAPATTVPPAAAPAAPLTLGDVSDLYGVELATIGRLNADVPLAAVGVPILGAIHQLTAADVSQGAYAAVASYYSAGAARPLSAADVEAYNPGVAATAGQTLRVPPVTCVVGAPGAPGTTLRGLASYFGLSTDALTAALRDVAAFPWSAPPAVDSQQHDVGDRLGVGNAGIAVSRPRPPDPPLLGANPTPQQKADYASAYLQTLFTMLSVGVEGTPFFTASRPALPSGPRRSLTAEEARAHRLGDQRAAALRAEATEPLLYEQTIGYGSVALVNAAPDPAGPDLPPKAENPYAGVGSVLELSVAWLDVFGNRAAPAATVTAAARTAPLAVDYADRLVGLSGWPNVRATYAYAGSSSAPRITLDLVLDAKPYLDPTTGPDLAGRDAHTFRTVYWQLVQNYDAAGVPGLSGPAVAMTLTNTLLADTDVPLDATQASAVRDFVAACLSYVVRVAGGQPPAEAPAAQVAVPLASPPRDDDVIPMSVALRFDRQAALTDPVLRATGGLSDVTPIMPIPNADAGDPSVSLDAFAKAFESVYTTSSSRLRLGTSAALPGESPATRDATLWAVRTATTAAGPGIRYSVAPTPSFYAPRPLARALRNQPATVGRYATGKSFPDGGERVMFTGADLNAWGQTAFAALDGFLTPTYATPAFIVDQLTISGDPETDGRLAKILAHKKALAAAIASTADPVLESSSDAQPSRAAATAKLEQALLDRLSAAFTVTAVTVLPVSGAAWNGPLPAGGVPPRLYGQPAASPAAPPPAAPDADQAERNFSLSSAKVPMTADGATHLAFLFDSRDAGAASHVPLDVVYAATHLEHDITSVPGIDGYQQSAWIAFVTGPLAPLDGGGAMPVDFPVVLRALPKPPSMVGQAATATYSDPTAPGELAAWTYDFTYLYLSAAQDSVRAVVEWNKPSAALRLAADVETEMFEALAEFVSVWPAVEADLETFLRPIDGKTTSAPAGAASALDALEKTSGRLAAAYTAWAAAPRSLAADAAPQHVIYEFAVELAAQADGSARVDVVDLSLQPSTASLPVPRVLIPGCDERELVPPAGGARASWTYTLRDEPLQPLSYAAALGISQRTVRLAGLDVFSFQDAQSSAQVVRNEDLVPSETTRPEFVFETPKVGFAEPLVPLLDFATFPLATANGGSSLASDLDAFFDALLAGAGGLEVLVKLQAGYAYRLVPGLTDLPETVLPVALLPPTATTTTPPAFVAPFAGAVMTWLGGIETTDPGARLTFGVEVFSGQDAAQQLPLLVVRDLSLLRSAVDVG